MSLYKKQEWIDHIEDIETGELLQQGTLYCARLMNHIEDGIEDAHIEIVVIDSLVKSLETRVNVLESNLVNNMPHNNFVEDFSAFGDIIIIDGIYDATSHKVYY